MTKDNFDEARVEAEAKAEFAEAVETLHSMGALDMMTEVSKLIPHLKLEVFDDFDKAGGRGFSPYITLRGEEDIVISEDEEIIESKLRSLSVQATTFLKGEVDVQVWESSLVETGGSAMPSGGLVWSSVSRAFNRGMLGRDIYNGLRHLQKLDMQTKLKLGELLLPEPKK